MSSFPQLSLFPSIDLWTAPPKRGVTGYAPKSVAERFFAKIRIEGECWIWTGTKNNHGYGMIGVGLKIDHDQRDELAHRVSWQLHRGEIPSGIDVCHNCPGGDNPACVNPDHLFLGTRLDNMRDATRKGRTAAGSRLPHTKLTDEQVGEICTRFAAGDISQDQLAAEFGVSRSYVSTLVTGVAQRRIIQQGILPQSRWGRWNKPEHLR